MAAIFTVSAVLLVVLFCIPAVLGWRRIQGETYPILPLMAGANLPGNILARFDVLWLAFLLYSIFLQSEAVFIMGTRFWKQHIWEMENTGCRQRHMFFHLFKYMERVWQIFTVRI